MKKWCVITAGPSAGKSSTLRELSSRGHRTAPEAARILFDQAISEGTSPEEKREESDFHEQVESIDRRIMRNMPDDETVFFDRSLVDNIAYRRHFGNADPDAILNLHRECENQYDYVFMLDRLPFKDDEVRSEDAEAASELHDQLRIAYEDIGCDPIDVPVMPVDERADFIENRIKRVAIH